MKLALRYIFYHLLRMAWEEGYQTAQSSGIAMSDGDKDQHFDDWMRRISLKVVMNDKEDE